MRQSLFCNASFHFISSFRQTPYDSLRYIVQWNPFRHRGLEHQKSVSYLEFLLKRIKYTQMCSMDFFFKIILSIPNLLGYELHSPFVMGLCITDLYFCSIRPILKQNFQVWVPLDSQHKGRVLLSTHFL